MTNHEPLPYVVTLRVMLHDDGPAQRVEWRGYAYSVTEAMLQAMFEHVGLVGANDEHIKVERITPDLTEYVAYVTRTEIEKALAEATPRTQNDWKRGPK